jgi:hypothetical protein
MPATLEVEVAPMADQSNAAVEETALPSVPKTEAPKVAADDIPTDTSLTAPDFGLAYWQTPKDEEDLKNARQKGSIFLGTEQPNGEFFLSGRGCFGAVSWSNIKAMRFISLAEPTLTLADFDFYLKFLRTFLNGQPWSGKLFKDSKGRLAVTFALPETTQCRVHDLIYVSAFRYAAVEFAGVLPYIVGCLRKSHDLEERFWIFQKMHHDFAWKKGEYYKETIPIYSARGGSDHCIVWPKEGAGYGGSAIWPITMERFRKNLANPIPIGIQAHFS